MTTFLAWRNLMHQKARTAVAVAGGAFAVVLMFMQLGFLGAVETTATTTFDALDFDVCLRSPQYLHLAWARSIPRERLYQAASAPGVVWARPFQVSLSEWRTPRTSEFGRRGEKRPVMVFGIRPGEPVFTDPEILQGAARLTNDRALLIDRLTRPEFGPAEGTTFGTADRGRQVEVGGRRLEIVGSFRLGSGLAANGAVLVGEPAFDGVFPYRTPSEVSLGLIKAADGADADAIAERLRRELPRDVEVLTRAEAIGREHRHWVWNTSFGMIFSLGVVVAFVVGVAIVYQILSSDVASRLPEYATLKAIGYRDRFLSGVVVQQAVFLALAAFALGGTLSEGLYRFTSARAGIPIAMNARNVTLVVALTFAMCVISGLAALRRLRKADPADLF